MSMWQTWLRLISISLPSRTKLTESILAQTYENLEILLVDDGTKDNCGAICDAYAWQDERVKAIHKKNGGLSSARNAGIDASTGEYLSFVDSDDWIEPDMYLPFLIHRA